MGRPDPARIRTSIVERSNLGLYEHPPLHSANECILEEMGEPLGCGCSVVCVLQFLSSASFAACDSGYGSGRCGPYPVTVGVVISLKGTYTGLL